MLVASWKPGFGLFKADAQKVADEIMEIGDEVKPEQILEKARDKTTELHKCFEWNDSVAAEKYRLHQARTIVCQLVIKEAEGKQETTPVRVFHRTENGGGYKSMSFIVKDSTEYQKLLEMARSELRAFKAKYHSLSEFEEIIALIE